MIGDPRYLPDDVGLVKSMGLTRESARTVRFDRQIADQPNLPTRTKMQGFVDFMLGAQSKVAQYSDRLSVSYQQGWVKGRDLRARLAGAPWIETENRRNGAKWAWAVFKEGYWVTGGVSKSESAAYDAIIDARIALKEGSINAEQENTTPRHVGHRMR